MFQAIQCQWTVNPKTGRQIPVLLAVVGEGDTVDEARRALVAAKAATENADQYLWDVRARPAEEPAPPAPPDLDGPPAPAAARRPARGRTAAASA